MQVSCAGLQCTPQLWTSCMGSMQRQAGPVLPARLQSLQVRQATKAAACRGSFKAILQHERLCQLHCRPVMRAGCIRAIPVAWGALPLSTLICTGCRQPRHAAQAGIITIARAACIGPGHKWDRLMARRWGLRPVPAHATGQACSLSCCASATGCLFGHLCVAKLVQEVLVHPEGLQCVNAIAGNVQVAQHDRCQLKGPILKGHTRQLCTICA